MEGKKFEEVDIGKRGIHKVPIEIKEVGTLLEWCFSTKRKNIGFGLTYKPTVEIELRLLTEQYRTVFNSLSVSDLKISPPPKKKSIIEKYSQKLRHRHADKSPYMYYGSGDETHPESNTTHSSLSKLMTKSKLSTAASETKFNYNYSMDESESLQEEDIEVEIFPIQKYESYNHVICGLIRVPLPGIYTLIFDNSFSFNTSKQVYFTYSVKTPDPDINALSSAISEKIDAKTDAFYNGWLLKRNKNRIQGWTKRWVEIGDGNLSYYDEPDGHLHGLVSIASCTITKIPDKKKLIFDSGNVVHHFRALNYEDYVNWVDIITSYKQLQNQEESSAEKQLQKKIKFLVSEIQSASGLLNQASNILLSMSEETSFKLEDQMNIVNILGWMSCFFCTKEDFVGESLGKVKLVIQDSSQLLENPKTQSKATEFINMAMKTIKDTSSVSLTPHKRDISVDTLASVDVYYDADDVILLEESSTESEESLVEEELEDAEEESGEDESTSPVRGLSVEDLETSSVLSQSIIPEPEIATETETKDAVIRRTKLPHPMIPNNVSIASVLRKNIGKDFSTLSMPLTYNEPVGALQKLCEDFEYSELLNMACILKDPLQRLVYIAAFVVSGYSSSFYRAERKPINPLLGETFECIREDKGFSFFAEKVSHHPPIVACHVTGGRGDHDSYTYSQDLRIRAKFWGKSIELIPFGNNYLKLNHTGDFFTWKKVTACVHNIIGGTPWIEYYGETKIINHSNGDTCTLLFKKERGIFSNSSENEVDGVVKNAQGKECYLLRGKWNECLYVTPCHDPTRVKEPRLKSQLIWKQAPMPRNFKSQYGFTKFAIELNELPESLKPLLPITDTRLRPDQRYYEEGKLELAEAEKKRLEDMQRERRKLFDSDKAQWVPKWFTKQTDPTTKEDTYAFNNAYWECKDKKAFPSDLVDLWPPISPSSPSSSSSSS